MFTFFILYILESFFRVEKLIFKFYLATFLDYKSAPGDTSDKSFL